MSKNGLVLRLICAMIVIVICLPLMVACNNNGDDNAQTSATTANNGNNPAPQVDPITLVADGEAKVRVLYNVKSGNMVISAAKDISTALSELGGVKVTNTLDFAVDNDDNALEILVGDTKYAASGAAMSALAPNSYSVTISGNKIIVVANNVYLYPKAVEDLLGAISVSEGVVTLAGDISVNETCSVLALAADKKTDYTIVYANADATAKTQATLLKNTFATAGITVEVSPDTKSAAGKEILIGNTNRAASANSGAYYLNSYTRADDNGNLAITGNLEAGVADLIKYVEDISRTGDTIEVPTYLFGLVTPKGFGNAPKYEGSGTVTLVKNHEKSNSYYVQAANATESDYKNYIKKLEAEGFKKHYATEAQESLFSIYTDGYNIVNLSYIQYVDDTAKYINIAVDCTENSALPQLEDNNEKVTDIQVTIVNSECTFLIRLEDGRFIVYDGGVTASTEPLYKQIMAQKVNDGKPVIAAWFISHHHGDHVGGFMNFLSKYKSNVTLESVIMSTPGKARLDTITDGTDYEYGWINSVFNGLKSHVPTAKIIMAHAGQRFVYSGVTVDVLYTPENYYGSDMFYGNHEVCIYSFDTENGRIIFTGDAQPENCKMVSAIYDDELQADFVQYAHHGYRGGDPTFYDLIGAKYGLWTNSIEQLKEEGKRPTPNYNGVDPNSSTKSIVPTNTESALVFSADMTAKDLEKYIKKTW